VRAGCYADRQCRPLDPIGDADRGNEAVSLSMARVDIPPAILSIAKRSSESGDLELEISLSDVSVGPDPGQQVSFADPLARPFKQHREEVEGAASEANWLPGFQQKSLAGEKLEMVERENTIDRGCKLFSHFDLDWG